MKSLIIFISGLASGYIVSNLKYKDFSDIIEEVSEKIQSWIEVTKDFVVDTTKNIEGFDSDRIQINVEAFLDALTEAAKELVLLETIEEKINFIEDEIAKISEKLIKKVK